MRRLLAILTLLTAPALACAFWGPGGMAGGGSVGPGAVAGGWTDTNNPVHYWPMENDAGTIPDQSLAGNDGTINDTLAFDYAVGAYIYDGADEEIAIALFALADASFGGWARWNGSASTLYTMMGMEGTFGLIRLDHNTDNGGAYLYSNDGANHFIGPTNAAVGDWHHYFATISNTTHRFYVDGVFRASWAGTPNAGAAANFIGSRNGSSFWYKGNLQHFRVYTNDLSAATVTTLFNANRTNEVVDTISTNDLLMYLAMTVDDNVRDYGSVPASGWQRPSPASGATYTLDGTNTVSGSPNLDRLEHSFDYDDSDDQTLVDSSNTSNMTNGFTVAAWVKRGNDTAEDGILARINPSDVSEADFQFFFNSSDKLVLTIQQSGDKTIFLSRRGPDVNIADGWVHVAATYAPLTNIVIYTNGIRMDASSANAGSFTAPSYETDRDFRIGNLGAAGQGFKGQLDEVKCYTNVLNAAEILNLANKTGLQGSPIQDNRDENRTEPNP